MRIQDLPPGQTRDLWLDVGSESERSPSALPNVLCCKQSGLRRLNLRLLEVSIARQLLQRAVQSAWPEPLAYKSLLPLVPVPPLSLLRREGAG